MKKHWAQSWYRLSHNSPNHDYKGDLDYNGCNKAAVAAWLEKLGKSAPCGWHLVDIAIHLIVKLLNSQNSTISFFYCSVNSSPTFFWPPFKVRTLFINSSSASSCSYYCFALSLLRSWVVMFFVSYFLSNWMTVSLRFLLLRSWLRGIIFGWLFSGRGRRMIASRYFFNWGVAHRSYIVCLLPK